LPLIPKAQDAMTSVVNLAIVCCTCTVEPDNSQRYYNCQDFHLLSLNFSSLLSFRTFSAPQTEEGSINMQVLMPLVASKSIICAYFTDSSKSPYCNTIFICQPTLYNPLHKQLFFLTVR
jgi:hypothetical protein